MRQWALRLLVFPPWVGSAQRKLDDQSESEHSSASARVRRVGQVCPLSFVWGRASGSVDGLGFASCLFTPFFSTMRVEEGVRERAPSMGGGGGTSFESLSRVLTAAHTPRLSPTEEKVAEELSASQTRLELVSKDPKAMAALGNLAALFETKETETVKRAS